MGFLLFLIASILQLAMAPVMYLYGSIRAFIKGGSKEWSEYNENLAIAKDQYGNGLCKYAFNWLMIKNTGYKFGNIDETISSVLGKNKEKQTLTGLGRFFDLVLNALEKDHSIKSIDTTENSETDNN